MTNLELKSLIDSYLEIIRDDEKTDKKKLEVLERLFEKIVQS